MIPDCYCFLYVTPSLLTRIHIYFGSQSQCRYLGWSLVVQWLGIFLSLQGHGFEPWSGKIPYAAGQLSLCATTTELASCSSRNHGFSNKDPAKPNIKISNKIKTCIYIYIFFLNASTYLLILEWTCLKISVVTKNYSLHSPRRQQP